MTETYDSKTAFIYSAHAQKAKMATKIAFIRFLFLKQKIIFKAFLRSSLENCVYKNPYLS